ncbi:MAG: ammonium transporter [Verrucomicrobiales bacterium]|nr:ammonium transporter [Verrucomicrobiales bacterium]
MAALLMMSVGNTIAQDATEPAKVAEATAPAAAKASEAVAEEVASISPEMFTINNLWICIAAALVFIMHLGFATLESGLTQSKNTVNILFKNVWIITSGLLLYAFWGFNSMYPTDGNGWFAVGGWFGGSLDNVKQTTSAYNEGYTLWGDFIFQAMFAATAATIVSGAVAERVKLSTFMVFSIILVGFFYPISGYWKWGGGWLQEAKFYDFAGSSVVHAFGGFAALACVLILGPRKGKYTKAGIKPIIGHSMPLATIGVFLLWLGWFGFNGGSVLSADPALVSYVFVTTSLGACGGAIAAIFASMVILKKPDLSMALNGILAGLVGITAGADVVSEASSIMIGAISGVLVFAAILIIDKLKIDDPVGAISVHGIGGVWGTIAVGIFSADHSVLTQVMGTAAISAFAFIAAGGTFFILKMIMGVRVSAEEEHEGLDIAEHGSPAYHLHM